jgi:hypothetical protein
MKNTKSFIYIWAEELKFAKGGVSALKHFWLIWVRFLALGILWIGLTTTVTMNQETVDGPLLKNKVEIQERIVT